jgi:hypothetical protein
MPIATASPCSSADPEGVAEVEQRPHAALALVGGDDGGLRPATRGDGVSQCRGIPRQHGSPVRCQPVEERRIAQQAVLHHLGIAGPELPVVQRRQRRDVGEDQSRLVE